ncbi:MAG: tetratricopeptide (TPR) repeat protein, partial [Candidatus Paceibacteria bacterium]
HLQGQALYFLARYSDCLTLLRLDDSRELLMHAEALRALGRLQELHELLPTLKEVLGNDAPEVLLIEAREDLRSKNYEAAIVRFRHVLQRQPLETEALFGLGQALGRMGKKEQALSVLEHHRQLLPLLDALDFAQRGVQLAPRRASNLAHLGDAWSALVLHDPGANTQARQAYVEAQRFASAKEMVPILLRWARHVASMEGDLSAACQILRNALKSSADPRLRVRLADYLSDMGKQDEALEQLKLVLRQRPGDSAVLERIRQLGQEQEGK